MNIFHFMIFIIIAGWVVFVIHRILKKSKHKTNNNTKAMALTQESIPSAYALAGVPNIVKYSTTQYAQDFIALHFKVYEYIDASWVQQGPEKRVTLNDDHEAELNISPMLAWDPDKAFKFPEEVGANGIEERSDLTKTYKVNVLEKYGIPLADGANADTASLKMLPGGLSFIQQGKLNDASTDWYTKFAALATRPFFTNVLEKTTDPLAVERLYILLTAAFSGNMTVSVYFNDGTSSSFTLAISASACVLELNTSFAALGIHLFSTKTAVKYTVKISDAGLTSDTFTYYVDHVINPDTRYFLFNNSFKVPEGIRFKGIGTIESENELKVVSKTVDKSIHSYSDAEFEIMEASERQYFTLNSGWVNMLEAQHYREFLLSKKMWWIINNMTLPVIPVASKIVTKRDGEHLFNFEFKYMLAHSDNFAYPDLENYTPDDSDLYLGSEKLSSMSSNNAGFPYEDYSPFSTSGKDIDLAIKNTTTAYDALATSNAFTLKAGDIITYKYELADLDEGSNPFFYLMKSSSGYIFSQRLELGEHEITIRIPEDGTDYYINLMTLSGEYANFYLTQSIKLASVILLKKKLNEEY
jgi:hypothetical protein